MNTKLRIDNILFEYLYTKLTLSNDMYSDVASHLISFDCQDTENDLKVECYFYFREDLDDTIFRENGKRLHQLLQVNDNYEWLVETKNDWDCKWKRLEIIVEFK